MDKIKIEKKENWKKVDTKRYSEDKFVTPSTSTADKGIEYHKAWAEKIYAAFLTKNSSGSIIDENREWYKSCYGLDQKQGDRSISFCGHALLSSDIFIVEDTRNDPKFADNPAVVGPPYIRFYAGVALRDQKTNRPIGVFCVKDFKPRKLSIKEIGLIIEIANRAERELNTKG